MDYTDEQIDAFLGLIEDGEFTKREQVNSGLSNEDLFGLAQFVYNDPNITLNVHNYTSDGSLVRSFAMPKSSPKEGNNFVTKNETQENEIVPSAEDMLLSDEEHKYLLKEVMEGNIDDVAVYVQSGVMSQEQKQEVINIFYQSNEQLIEIHQMSSEQRSDRMEILEDKLNQMSGNIFSKYIEAHSDSTMMSQSDRDIWNAEFNERRSNDPEFSELAQRYIDIRDADMPDGKVQKMMDQSAEITGLMVMKDDSDEGYFIEGNEIQDNPQINTFTPN